MWKLSNSPLGRPTAGLVVERPVDAAEHQRHVAQIELGEPVEHGLVEHIALVAGLEGAAERAFVQATHLPRVDLALLEAVVRVVDELLLSGEIGVMLRHENRGPQPGRRPENAVRQLYRRRPTSNRAGPVSVSYRERDRGRLADSHRQRPGRRISPRSHRADALAVAARLRSCGPRLPTRVAAVRPGQLVVAMPPSTGMTAPVT